MEEGGDLARKERKFFVKLKGDRNVGNANIKWLSNFPNKLTSFCFLLAIYSSNIG